MKIATVEAFPLAIPYEHGGPPASWGGGARQQLNTLLVRVETDDGLVGWGEAFSYNCMPAVKAMLDSTIAPVVVGRDASSVVALMWDLQKELHLFGRYGITMFALSGLDIALWDITAKAANVPLSSILGGRGSGRERLKGYASLLNYGDSDLVREHVDRAISGGFRAIKLHETDVAAVAAARDAAGPGIPLAVDVNCPWTPQQAREHALAFRRYDLHWLEEPIFPPEDFRALARLQAEVGIPIAAGENACTAFQFQAMFEANAVRYAQPSVTKVGGITEFRKVVALAETHGVTVMPHSPYFGPGWLATLQLITSLPGDSAWVEYFFCDVEASLFGDYIKPGNDGSFAVPDGPGLGCEPDADVMRDYAIDVNAV